MSKRSLFILLDGLILALALLIGLTLSAHADIEPAYLTLHVNNNLADAPDASPGDGKCETVNGNGICTLRAAIQESNAHAGPDTIIIDTGDPIYLSRAGEDNTAFNGDLDITGQVTIYGNNTILAGGKTALGERVLHVLPAAKVRIIHLAVRFGAALGGASGGGILNEGTLTLEDVGVTSSTAFTGGGISNQGTLTMLGGGVRANSARSGGGLANSGTATILNAYLNHNSADFGGGIYNWAGTILVTNSTISTNQAETDGGGILNQATGAVSLFNVTITHNEANSDLDATGDGGGIRVQAGGVSFGNTILSDNYRKSINGSALNECKGSLHSLNYNLIRSAAGCTVSGSTSNNIVGTSASLGDLQVNGGPTYTHALLPNSPAIDAGNPAGCADPFGGVLSTDQRGYIRPVDGDGNFSKRCDIGAFEFGSPGAPTATPTPTLTPTLLPTNTPLPGTATPTSTPIPNSCISKPAAPILVIPSNNAVAAKKKVKLNWDDAVCADKYRVLVKQNGKGGPRADKKTISVSRYKTKALAKGHAYHWRVKACNSKGCTKSAWSMFTINP